MTAQIHWPEIALRLALTLAAGGILGAERSKSGHPAGLRTTLLVTLAASLSMIQMNLLMPTNGKPPSSYIVMDLMRLPLGILTGVGFIGAGAIVRKGEIVVGITTAATMWFATVVGLCLGGGQLALGMTSAGLGFLILWALRLGEAHLETRQRGVVTVTLRSGMGSAHSIASVLRAQEAHISSMSAHYDLATDRDKFRFEVNWRQPVPAELPAAMEHLRQMPGILACEWRRSDKPMRS